MTNKDWLQLISFIQQGSEKLAHLTYHKGVKQEQIYNIYFSEHVKAVQKGAYNNVFIHFQ